MKYYLEVSFTMDDTDPQKSSKLERICEEVRDTVSDWTDSWKPKVEILNESAYLEKQVKFVRELVEQ